ncbi:MAG TPA: hypothetical protein VFZ61_33545, partial [Polyangiales bacterium]
MVRPPGAMSAPARWLVCTLLSLSCGQQPGDDAPIDIDPVVPGADAALEAGTSSAGSDAASAGADAAVSSGSDASAPDGADPSASTDASADAEGAADGSPSTPDAAAPVDAGSDAAAPPGPAGPLFPAHMAKEVCPDPELRIRTGAKPSLGNSGKIQVFDSAAPGRAVAVVDMAVGTISETRGGTSMRLPRPVYVAGNDVYVHLPGTPLSYGKSYHVTIDSGVIQVAGGAAPTFAGANAWQFSTRAAPPADKSNLRVALDG